MESLTRFPNAALSFSEVVVLKGDTDEIDRFSTNPTAPRNFDLSNLPAYMSPDQLRTRMKEGYLPIASNTAVIRVDALREFGGFPPALRWFADSFTCTALAMRHGVCVIPEPLALIRSQPESYSQRMRDKTQQTEVLNALLELLSRREFRDIRASMKQCPSNLTVYDPLILRALARRPRDWDFFLTYGCWKLRDYATQQLCRARSLAARLWSSAREAWPRSES